MLNSSHNSEKVSSSSKKRRQLLRQLLRLRKLRKWTSSASLADWLYLLSLCFIALFLVSIILGVILLSYTWTTVTIFFICGLCVTLGYWKVLSSRKKRRWLRRQFFRLRKWTSSASLANWLGLLVFCLIVLLSVSMLLKTLLSFNALSTMIISISGWLGCSAVAFTSEVVRLAVAYWGSPLRKTFLPVVGAISMISMLASQLLLNLITRVDAAHFPKALIIFTAILVPIAWLVLAVILLLLFCVSCIALLYFSFVLLPIGLPLKEIFLAVRNHRLCRFLIGTSKIPHRNLSFWKGMNRLRWTGRAWGAGALAAALIFLSCSVLNQYQVPIYRLITTVLVYSNYQPISDECKNYSTGEWVASIGKNKISVAKPEKFGGYTFQTRSCK